MLPSSFRNRMNRAAKRARLRGDCGLCFGEGKRQRWEDDAEGKRIIGTQSCEVCHGTGKLAKAAMKEAKDATE